MAQRNDVMDRQAGLLRAVQASPLLGKLKRAELSVVLQHGRTTKVPRDHHVRHVEDDTVAVILDGIAVASVLPHSGDDQVITDFLGPGASDGLAVVLGQPTAGTDVVALTPVEALLLPGPDLRRCLSDLPEFGLACLKSLAADLALVREECLRFSHTSTTERVIARLVELADDWGVPSDDGIRVTLPLTQAMLASWARSSRESTAKVLSDLRQARVIRTARRELTILDVERLRARTGRAAKSHDELLRSLLRAMS